jgi:hypothetical protein
MQTSPQSECTPPDEAASHQTADRAYQALTVAAMLLLLVSLWVF